MDAVRKAEARGSLTSLPDLIRRATRLAASLEKGKRPASRLNDLDDFPEYGFEKHRSGLSDMLAAFPPPAHLTTTNSRRSFRDSIRDQVQSWPLPLNFNRTLNTSQEAVPTSDSDRADGRRRRRCCGLPCWAFILVVIIILILIAAAVVIPVEFFVIRPQNDSNRAQADLQQCQQQLTCANGGTNILTDGVCACRCLGGFTGRDCTAADDAGCTTITLTGSSTSATIGAAIPRLLEQAQSNFSIPLSANEIVSALSAGDDLSCSASNALVTFNGRATRRETDITAAALLNANTLNANSAPDTANNAVIIDGVLHTTITVVLGSQTTFTLSGGGPRPTGLPSGDGTSFSQDITTGGFATTLSVTRGGGGGNGGEQPSPTGGGEGSATATSRVTTTMTMSSGNGAPVPTSGFAASEETLDFARVAVLYILQEDSLGSAEAAQVALQRFFSFGGGDGDDGGDAAARNVTVGGGRSVDLLGFVLDMGGGEGRVGGGPSSSSAAAAAVGDGRRRRGVVEGEGLGGRHLARGRRRVVVG
jgi:hypothetical protein